MNKFTLSFAVLWSVVLLGKGRVGDAVVVLVAGAVITVVFMFLGRRK